MPEVTLSINRKTGKYEGRGAVPFTNQPAVRERILSDVARPDQELPLGDALYRRFTVHFVSGHRYVLDLGRTYLEHHGVDIQDTAASLKFLEARFANAEVFRRSIRDFSKQLPVVYEFATVDTSGAPTLRGHVAPAKRESAWETRIIPQGVI